MPYIEKQQRDLIDVRFGLNSFIFKIGRIGSPGSYSGEFIPHPGTLNYIITRLVCWWLGDNPNYERYNAAIGVLECAKQELYRRQIALYEDEKCEENGDVYKNE